MATSPGLSQNVRSILVKDDFSGVANNISFAAVGTGAGMVETEGSVTGKQFKRDKFSRKNRFQCTFCLGKGCSKEQW